MAVLKPHQQSNNNNDIKNNEFEPLIPGLPDEISELCLLHLPYPYQALVRSVSSSWNRTITHPSFLLSKKTLSPSLLQPNLFVFAFHKPSSKFQWQALNPSSGRWFLLPPMPLPETATCPDSLTCASLPQQGKLFVMSGTGATLVYHTAANQWSPAAEIPAAKSLLAAEGINGRIITVGGGGGLSRATEIYDPESDTWTCGTGLNAELAHYETAVTESHLYVTEGWRWPFIQLPRGFVYEVNRDTWRDMSGGMREGWIGVTVTVNGRLFVIAEYGDSPVKVYDEESDTWQNVRGGKFPREALQRPFVGRGMEGKMYVVGCGLNVVIGSVVEVQGEVMEVMWEVMEAPKVFADFSPCNCQLLYA